LILFYTPWCKSCEDFKYKWSETALLFKNRFFIGAVNVENQKNENDILRNELEITTYPTIVYVAKNGKIQKYGGTRNINEIVHFICKKEKLKC
jgi:thioredoxin-like negative regulator of GroEL